MSTQTQPTGVTLLPFQAENVSTNQQGVPLPYLGGERVMAARWITPAMDKLVLEVQGAGKKG